MPDTYVVVATHNRHDVLVALLDTIQDCAGIVVIDNASSEPLTEYLKKIEKDNNVTVIEDDEQPPNLSRLWNLGLDEVARLADRAGQTKWNVAILNDDVLLPHRWLTRLGSALRMSTAVVAYGDQFHRSLSAPINHTVPEPIDLQNRMCGFAHISKGELGLRFDETLRWWFSDDDYDWRCRELGGSMLVPELAVVHTSPDGQTNENEELLAQASRDRITFQTKWGKVPW